MGLFRRPVIVAFGIVVATLLRAGFVDAGINRWTSAGPEGESRLIAYQLTGIRR